MRYAFKVQYIGKNYAGSQLQPDKPTIQGELEKALSTLIKCDKTIRKKSRHCVPDTQSQDFYDCAIPDQVRNDVGSDENIVLNNRPIKTIFSGRTDRGVNSTGQVVHFDIDKPIVASKFIYSLNEILPADISVSDLKEVDPKFHAQKSAKKRHYVYEFVNRKCKNAFDGDLLRIKYEIDMVRMQKALDYIKGEHDFSSFKTSGTHNPSKVCFIYEAKAERAGDRVIINIIGNRFLYNMVRAIVGTLLEIEGHNLPAEHMKNVLEACDRRKAGQNVIPYGLTLVEVTY